MLERAVLQCYLSLRSYTAMYCGSGSHAATPAAHQVLGLLMRSTKSAAQTHHICIRCS
jgi:hypothetical protein